MSQLPVWGIDVTASTLRAVQLTLGDEGKVRCTAWDVIDFAEDVADVRSAGRYDAMRRAVRRFVRHQDVKNLKVVASIRGETAFVRTVTVPQLDGESLDKILAYEAQQQIPFPLDEVYWDRRVLAIREGGEVVVSLYAIRKAQVDDRLKKLGSMGLPIDALQLRPVALQNFCAFERLLVDGTIVVDFDYSGLQILIAHDDRVWFRCLPTGGCDFVEKIAMRLRVKHDEAVRLAAGQVQPKQSQVKQLEELRASAAREVAAEVSAQIRYYLSLHATARPNRILLFTCHPACPPLAGPLATETGMKVGEPRGFRSTEIAEDVVAAGLQENFAGLARAAGLALHGLGKADTAIRLYPETIPRSFSRGKAGYLVAAAAILVGICFAWLRRDALRNDYVEASGLLRTRLATAREFDRARLEQQRLADDPVAPLVAKWKARAEGREGRAAFVDGLLDALSWPKGAARDEAKAPLLAALEAGDVPGKTSSPGAGRLVLARIESGPRDQIDAEMDALVKSMVGQNGLKDAKAAESWSAGEPTATKPPADDERLLRVRFRHRAYALTFEGAP